MVNVESAFEFLLGNAAMPTLIAVALASVAPLLAPVWAIVINVSALPNWTVLPCHKARHPRIAALSVAKMVCALRSSYSVGRTPEHFSALIAWLADRLFPRWIVFSSINAILYHPCSRAFRTAEIMLVALESTPARLAKLLTAIIAFNGKFSYPSRMRLAAIVLSVPSTAALSVAELQLCIDKTIRVALKYFSASITRNGHFGFLRWHKKRLLLTLTEHLLRVRRGQQEALKAYQSLCFPSTTTTPSASVIVPQIRGIG